jgi:SAM-dependent methyltransferase
VLRRHELVRAALDAQPGDRVLDVGCGPGFYVTELLEAVGPEGSVAGVVSCGWARRGRRTAAGWGSGDATGAAGPMAVTGLIVNFYNEAGLWGR